MPSTRILTIAVVLTTATVAYSADARADAPCPEYIRLRNLASDAWQQAMRAPQTERCTALDKASQNAAATLSSASNSAASCNISAPMQVQVEAFHREIIQARDNVCDGRPLRHYPAEIIRQ